MKTAIFASLVAAVSVFSTFASAGLVPGSETNSRQMEEQSRIDTTAGSVMGHR